MDEPCQKAEVSKVMRQFLLRSSTLTEDDIGITKKLSRDEADGDLEVDAGKQRSFLL